MVESCSLHFPHFPHPCGSDGHNSGQLPAFRITATQTGHATIHTDYGFGDGLCEALVTCRRDGSQLSSLPEAGHRGRQAARRTGCCTRPAPGWTAR